ncbi:MAG: glycosyltransferase [Kiritimatiellae bacterium]|nr:glycosyltransferase [Kiritimatiellia bacterium]
MRARDQKPRVGLFLMAGDMTGGGGAERQFSDTYDAFQQRSGPLDVWLVTDRFTLGHLQAVGRPRSAARLLVLRSLGGVRGRPARSLRSLWRRPGAWLLEFAFKCARRIEHLLLIVQCFRAALRFDLIHIALLRRFHPPFLRALARLPAALRPRISLSIVDCRLAHSLMDPRGAEEDIACYMPLLRGLRPDGVLSWYELFKSVAERLKLFPGRTRIHASRYCFVDLSRCAAAERKDRLVIFAGRLTGVKQPLLFIEAVRLLLEQHGDLARGWTFAMYGRGDLEPAVRVRLEETGLRDRVALASSGNMPAVFAKSRLFVSTQDYENFTSLAMLEAMACGNAVVARDVGQTARFVEDGVNGFLARPDSAEGVARAIARYLSLPEQHDRMQAESRRLATEEHSVEHFLAETEAYWLKLLEPGAGEAAP